MTEADPIQLERRRHERRPVERACKLIHPSSLRYLAARTRDLSSGGALLELPAERPLAVGDRVDVLVDWDSRGLVSRGSTVGATVVRVGDSGPERQSVGVEFDRELGATLAA
ncbi:MAG TPA: PilZ domain-containing protein [Phycisphaerales bacterium]|nr:PilZ domain-containing protein [Phycisphaerales bacterium]